MGRRGAAQRARGGQADPALDRLCRLPLVPRDGARVLRGRAHRARDERELRLHQGRPRGAARPRLGLHGRGRRPDRAWRLADDRLPAAERRAVLRRHLLPARAAARPALVQAGADRGRRGLARPARRGGRLGTAARRPPPGGRAHPRLARAVDERGAADRATPPPRRLRRAVGRLGPRAEVPAGAGARVPAPPRRGGPDAPDARRDGARRHVRPRRRRLPSLLRRRALARAALREDALRQRAARVRVPARVAPLRRRALPIGSQSRRSTTCCASSHSRAEVSRRRRTPTPTASRD